MRRARITLAVLGLSFGGVAVPGHLSAPAAAQPVPTCEQLDSSDDNEPPCNPHLAQTSWPANHRDSYAQASSPEPGPLGPADQINVHHEGIEAAPIILTFSPPYPDGKFVVWGSTVGAGGTVFKLDPEEFVMIDEYSSGGSQEPGFSGAYNVLSRDNRLYSTLGQNLMVYGDDPTDRLSPIELVAEFPIPPAALCRPDSDEIVVGINMTFDGHIAFATSFGTIGVVPHEPENLTADNLVVHSINGERCDDPSVSDEELEEVANTIATDEGGGVYVITDTAQYRIQWDGTDLAEAWRVDYDVERDRGGSLGPGSGASPTLMGTKPDDDRFVVIYDDATIFNLMLLWRDEIPADWMPLEGEDPRVACKLAVDFGRDDGEAWSEQSPLVRGNSVVLVNDRLQFDPLLEQVPSRFAGFNQLTGGVPGNEPRGVERIDWDPSSRTCATVWQRPELSIPNTIPTMSIGSEMFYGVGVRDGNWTLEALDWATGESVFTVETGPYPTMNSFWAASTVGPDEAIYNGTFGGVTRWQQCDPEGECGRRPSPDEFLVGDLSDNTGDPGDGGGAPSDEGSDDTDGAAERAEQGDSDLPTTGGGLALLGLAVFGLGLSGRRARP